MPAAGANPIMGQNFMMPLSAEVTPREDTMQKESSSRLDDLKLNAAGKANTLYSGQSDDYV